MAVLKKTSRACTGMLSHENDAFKFSNSANLKHKEHVHLVHHCPRARGTVFFPNQAAVDQKHEPKSSHRAVLYILQNIEIWILVTFH